MSGDAAGHSVRRKKIVEMFLGKCLNRVSCVAGRPVLLEDVGNIAESALNPWVVRGTQNILPVVSLVYFCAWFHKTQWRNTTPGDDSKHRSEMNR